MMHWVILAVPLLIVIGFAVTRILFHFNTCKNVSSKNPGEKLTGCPSWTHVDVDEDEDEDEKEKERHEDE